MVFDFEQGGEPSAEYDVCVVGSGACGIAVAMELASSPLRTIVIESGGERPEARITDLHQCRFSGRSHAGSHTGRARVFGGTTTLWGGQALPLFPLDFSRRSWVTGSGWPITDTELEEEYRQAERLLQIPGAPYGVTRTANLPAAAEALPWEGQVLETVFSQWSPSPNLAKTFRRAIYSSSNLTLLLHGNATEVELDRDASSVQSIRIASLTGRIASVKARQYVLCLGGIENPRLLLASRSRTPAGVGNGNDLVGRYFQDHVAAKCGYIRAGNRERLVHNFSMFLGGREKYLPKVRTTDRFQEQRAILNVIGNVCFEWPLDSSLPALRQSVSALLRRQRPNASWRDLRYAGRDFGDILGLGWRQFFGRRSYVPSQGPIYLEAHAEQEPDADSRICLADECDGLGMPRALVKWRVSDLTIRSIRSFAEAVGNEFQRLGLGELDFDLPALKDTLSWESRTSDMLHHMGTTRMHDDAKFGVVDRHCRVHGLSNLYIGSASTFPTGGSSNPTLTAMALSIRIARRLAKQHP